MAVDRIQNQIPSADNHCVVLAVSFFQFQNVGIVLKSNKNLGVCINGLGLVCYVEE